MTNGTILNVDADAVEEIASALDLRLPNKQALETIAFEVADYYARTHATFGFEGIVESATGVGKTYVIAGAIEYFARVEQVRDFVIIAPSRTILTKTISNFTAGHSRSLLAGLSVPIVLVTADTFATPAVAAAMEDDSVAKVYVFTVQALLAPSEKQRKATRNFQESLGADFYARLKLPGRLMVFADEHHTYYGPKFSDAVRDLQPWALIGLTATPDKRTPPELIIFRYPLAAAIADQFVKTPVIVGRRDDRHDNETKLADGLTLLEHKREIAARYCAVYDLPQLNPIMLVVARDTEEANQWAEFVRAPSFMEGRYAEPGRVLVIHSNVPISEEAKVFAELEKVEASNSPVRVVVSVAMLKEGWDVKNVYVLLSTQPSLSEILTEQVLGRGLRLPFGKYTGIEMLDTLEVIAHERYENLLVRKNALNKGFIDFTTRTRLHEDPDGTRTLLRDRTTVDAPLIADEPDDERLFPPETPVVGQPPNVGRLNPPVTGGPKLTDLYKRVKEGADVTATLAQPLRPSRKIQVPIVEVKSVESVFAFSDITDVEPFRALGRRLRAHPDDELRRTLINARIVTDAAGRKRTEMFSQQATDGIKVQGALLPAPVIRGHLVDAILFSPVAPSRKADIVVARRALEPLLDAFFDGLNGGADELLSAYLERASARIVELVMEEARRYMPHVKVLDEVKISDFGPERLNTRAVEIDHHGPFARQKAYGGWRRSIYDLQWFDSKPERTVAIIADEDSTVAFWTKLQTGEIPILWNGDGRKYNADLVVVQEDGHHWIVEVKADDDSRDPEVLAKRDVARRYVQRVNASGILSVQWHYVLATETDIDQARGSWSALRGLGN